MFFPFFPHASSTNCDKRRYEQEATPIFAKAVALWSHSELWSVWKPLFIWLYASMCLEVCKHWLTFAIACSLWKSHTWGSVFIDICTPECLYKYNHSRGTKWYDSYPVWYFNKLCTRPFFISDYQLLSFHYNDLRLNTLMKI